MRVLRVFLWTLCATYWVALLILTHLPSVPVIMPSTLSDKAAHFIAYAVLAGVMYLALWASSGAPGRTALSVIAIALLYGALDEITQPLVGRACEFYDWLADAAGAVFVVAVIAGGRLLSGNARHGRAAPDPSVPAREGA